MAGELADSLLVHQPVDQITFDGIGECLIEARLQIHETPRRIVFSHLRPALAGHADVDHLDREAVIAQMQPEIVADADRINPHEGKTDPEFVKQADHLPARVLTPPGSHPDDFRAVAFELADVNNRLRLSSSDVDAGNQRARPGVGDRILQRRAAGPAPAISS